MTTFASVLRSGGDYGPEHVRALYRGVREHWPGPLDFVCLTDTPIGAPGVREVPLERGWPGWWSKLELFRPDVFEGPVVYMDLDTLPIGDLSDLASYAGPLAMLSDFYRPRLAQSGVMLFEAGPKSYAATLYEAWLDGPAERHMRAHRGDGEWLSAYADGPHRIQDLFPGQVVSLKVHAKGGPPPGARLVCFHGHPRPHDPAAGWAHHVWRERAE